MTAYIIRRLGTAVVVVFGLTLVTFILLHVISSSPGRAVLGLRASPQAVAAFNRAHGYDRPLFVQFFSYVWQLLQGNLGFSYKLNQSVNALLGQNAGRSAYLSGVALVLAVVIAVPLGIYQAVKRNSIGDYTFTSIAFTLYSMPSFLLGLTLIWVFSFQLNLLPSEATQSESILHIVGDPRGMVMAILTQSLVVVAGFSRYMRSSAIDNLAQDYIKLARAKGLSEAQVLRRHLFRNSCLPIITLIGLSIPSLLAGNLIAEVLFNYHGLGLLFLNSLQNEDYPVLLAYTLIGGILTVVGNLIADVSLTVADPRIRLT